MWFKRLDISNDPTWCNPIKKDNKMDSLEQKIRDAFEQIPYGTNGGNILDNNVVYSLEIDKDAANVVLVIGDEYQNIKDETVNKVEDSLKALDEINSVSVRVVAAKEEIESAQQPTNPAGLVSPERTSYLQEYKNVILVASGKGGVGKSTVAINMAMALKSLGKQVSMLDADVFGPSIPLMLGQQNEDLKIEGKQIKPMSQFGIEFMSVGNMVKEEEAVIWRGPMAHQVIQHILRDTAWPGGDYIIVDLPPGTSDIQLSISQLTTVTGAVIVCTPQDVALIDARKAISMFEKVNIPVLGIIENMSSFICPKCGEETPIFARGGAERESESKNLTFLGRIPIDIEIRVGSDSGDPVVHSMPNSAIAKNFVDMAKQLDKMLEEED